MPKPVKLGRKERMTFSKIDQVAQMPNLIQIQTESYNWFIEEGLKEVFEDISPIQDYAGNLALEFIDYSLNDPPKYEQEECKERDVTYAAPLKVRVRLINKETGEVKEHPTYKRIQEYVQEKYGFKVHTAYIVEVKRMVGLDMHKAPNAVEQKKHEYHPCPPEKVEAIKDALRHFGLISE